MALVGSECNAGWSERRDRVEEVRGARVIMVVCFFLPLWGRCERIGDVVTSFSFGR